MSTTFKRGDKVTTAVKIITDNYATRSFEEVAKLIAEALQTNLSEGRAWFRNSVRQGRIEGVSPDTVLWPKRTTEAKKTKVARGGNPENLKKIQIAAAKLKANKTPVEA